MPLTDPTPLIRHAAEHGYALAAVNTNGGTYDLVRAIAEAAQEERAPVMMAGYQKNLAYRGLEYAAWVIRHWAERVGVPIVAHLDHGDSVETCRQAIEAGFTSVMIDGSHLPIDENIALTREVSAIAKPRGIGVEAEVGELQKLGPDGAVLEVKNLADPREVARMSQEGGIDMLAVGIGNAHGFYKGEPSIRTDLLAELAAASRAPLVLHGTTGLSDDVVSHCIELGIAKVNLGTLVRANYVKHTARTIAAGEHQNHPWRVSLAVKELIKEDVRHLIRLTGSAGQGAKIAL